MANDIVCGSCRRSNDPWRRHCGGCGSGLPGGCPSCGVVNREDEKFCGGCAHALRFSTGTARGSSQSARKRVPSTQVSTIPIDISELLPHGPQRG